MCFDSASRPGDRPISPHPWSLATTLVTASVAALAASDGFAAETNASKTALEQARSTPVFTLYFENDTFEDQDRHYTNGLKLTWTSADLAQWGQEGWRQRFVEALPFMNHPDGQKNFGFALGQNIYTPQDISRVPPDPNDRPYAGWTYFEFSFISKNHTVMDSLSFQLGIVGPHSYAEDLQKVTHEWLNDEQPAGWDYQLKDEPGLNIVYERSTRWYVRAPDGFLGADLVPHLGFSLGNVQTYANAGATGRVGFNLPSDFGVNLIRAAGLSNSPVEDVDPRLRGSVSVFIFGGVDGRAVARDLFLDGNTFKDSPSVDKKTWVGDAYYGAGVVLGNWQITYTQVTRTREFEAQEEASKFGSVTISTTW